MLGLIARHLADAAMLASAPVHTAFLIGGGAAIVSAVIGVPTVIRGQSFAGHALADISSAGGSASFLLGIHPLPGFLGAAILAATGLHLMDVERTRERDVLTGIVLGAGLGVAALLLYVDVTTTHTRGVAITVMFGSMFAIAPGLIPWAMAVAAAALIITGAIYRPLLLASLDAGLAHASGVAVRRIGYLHLAVLALAVSLAALTIGAVLSTALLVGPAAAAVRLVARPGLAMILAAAIGLASTWGGIVLAYNSYDWTPGHGWPVSSFVVTLVFVAYLTASLLRRSRTA